MIQPADPEFRGLSPPKLLLLLSALLVASALPARAQEEHQHGRQGSEETLRKILRAVPTEEQITVDGELNEPALDGEKFSPQNETPSGPTCENLYRFATGYSYATSPALIQLITGTRLQSRPGIFSTGKSRARLNFPRAR